LASKVRTILRVPTGTADSALDDTIRTNARSSRTEIADEVIQGQAAVKFSGDPFITACSGWNSISTECHIC